MKTMEQFKEAKLLKERGVTPKNIFKKALDESEHINNVVLSVQYEDGSIQTAYSYEESLSALGMLEISKEHIRESMED